jgi:uncharacterized protein YdeI (YjbR/CyaY-like superfamily)
VRKIQPVKVTKPELPTLVFKSQKAWAAWLKSHHADSPGVWLKIARKSAGRPSLTSPQALEEALCYGWIDGQTRSLDETAWLQKYTRRGPRSIWSKVNREKVQALIEAGRMQPAGLAAIAQAQAAGRWAAAYDPPSRSSLPADFQAELDRHPQARAFFDALDSHNRYAITFRLQTAKKPETRARRIRQFIDMLLNKEKIHP